MLVTATEVAKELGCSRSTIYSLAKRGQIPCVRVGDLVRFSMAQVLAALESSNAPAATESPSTFRRKTAT